MNMETSFLGSGWSFPPSFGKGGRDVKMVLGEEDIHQSLQVLLSTSIGERIMNEEYGCALRDFQFESTNSSLFLNLETTVSNALKLYEPRIKVAKVDVSLSNILEGEILITIEYDIRSTNSRYNLVFPFYVNEAIQPPDKAS